MCNLEKALPDSLCHQSNKIRLSLSLLCSGLNPNITGTFAASYYTYRKVFDTTGAFTEKLSGGTDGNTEGHSLRNAGITFNASNGNSIYQGATVQSPALQALIIIKV